MILWIILISTSFGVYAAGVEIIAAYRRRQKAKREWDEFNRNRDL